MDHVHTIFVMLGEGCNFHCRYCLQHVDGGLTQGLPSRINPKIYQYIADHIGPGGLMLNFFGGEPLLYYDQIREIIEHTAGLPGIGYSMVSNGSLLTPEMVTYFNNHDVRTTFSWDGRISWLTRGRDVMDSKEDLILDCKYLGLSAVLSKFATPKQIIEDFKLIDVEYRSRHGYGIRINIDEIFDTGVPDKEVFDVDYKQVEREMDEMCDEYFDALRNHKIDYTDLRQIYVDGLVGGIRQYYRDNVRIERGYCGSGISMVNMDLQGLLYYCHNTSDIAGSIYDDEATLHARIMGRDDTAQTYSDLCRYCPAVSSCRGGCKLIPVDQREAYCRLKRAVRMPVLRHIQEFAPEGGRHEQRGD